MGYDSVTAPMESPIMTAQPLASPVIVPEIARREQNPYWMDSSVCRTINVSGGRSSGYMLFHILEAHQGELPDTVKCVFANTGKEREETLDFVDQMEKHWGVPITWLEYEVATEAKGGPKDPIHRHKVVTYATASRKGEPYFNMVKHAGILPNVMMRTCTKNLKVGPIEWYVRRELKWDVHNSKRVIGFRFDEERRWGPKLYEECQIEFPMVWARATKPDVLDFWHSQNFDLQLPDNNYSNCDLCFLKGKNTLRRLIREDPSRADWWIEMEDMSAEFASRRNLYKPEQARFSKNQSYRQLKEEALQPDLFDWHDSQDDDDDDGETDCSCTD